MSDIKNSPAVADDKVRSLTFLSLLCFTLADIRDGLGPFLGVYLQGNGWSADHIGYAMTVGGMAGMLFTTPMGALTDRTKRKRLLIGIISIGIVLACALIFKWTNTASVWTSVIVQKILAAAIAPALTGMTIGLVGQKGLAARIGKNEAWNHFGTCATALMGGLVGVFYGIPGVFAVMALMGGLTVFCLRGIDPTQINHDWARGLEPAQEQEALPSTIIFKDFSLLALGVILFFFHMGNAAMLPLLGQSAVARFDVNPALYTATTVFVAQITMIVTSLWGAKTALSRGYGVLFLIALISLPIRGFTAGFFNSPWSLVPVQILDGIGAGLMGVATPGVVARLLKGSGHINMGFGFVMTIQGVGAALSSSFGGLIVRYFSYSTAFLGLALAPCAGLILFVMAAKFFSRFRYAVSSTD